MFLSLFVIEPSQSDSCIMFRVRFFAFIDVTEQLSNTWASEGFFP